jgi:hypothetical protein
LCSLLEEQPCIIDITAISRTNAETDREHALFVCATEDDATLLLQHDDGRLAVGALGNFLFSISPASIKKSSDENGAHFQPNNDKEQSELAHIGTKYIDFDVLIEDVSGHGDGQMQVSPPALSTEVKIQLLSILRELQNDPSSAPFFIPDEDEWAEYRANVPEAVDLSTVTKRVILGLYASPLHFATDVRKVWRDCLDYFPIDCDVSVASSRLSAYFEELFPLFLATRTKNEVKNDDPYQYKSLSLSESDVNPLPVDDSGYEDDDEGEHENAGDWHTQQLAFSRSNEEAEDDEGWTLKSSSKLHHHDEGEKINRSGNVKGSGNGDDSDIILPSDNGITLVRNGVFCKTIRIARFLFAQHLGQVLKWNEDNRGGGHSDSDPVADMFAALKPSDCNIEIIIDKQKRKQKVCLRDVS